MHIKIYQHVDICVGDTQSPYLYLTLIIDFKALSQSLFHLSRSVTHSFSKTATYPPKAKALALKLKLRN